MCNSGVTSLVSQCFSYAHICAGLVPFSPPPLPWHSCLDPRLPSASPSLHPAVSRHVLAVHSSASRPQGLSRGGAAAGATAAADANVDAAAAAAAATAADAGAAAAEGEAPISEALLKRFIHYARTHCFPRLEEGSASRLVAKYVELRDKVRVLSESEGVVMLSGGGCNDD